MNKDSHHKYSSTNNIYNENNDYNNAYSGHPKVDGLQLLIESSPDGLNVGTGDTPHSIEEDEVWLLLAQVNN